MRSRQRIVALCSAVVVAVGLTTFTTSSRTSAWWATPPSVIQAPSGGVAFGRGIVSGAITVLPNGNYVISDFQFPLGVDRGAVYLFNGATHQLISTLTGSTANDQVGSNGIVILNGSSDFLVRSGNWANGSATKAGAVTWCSGTTGCDGNVSVSNSLVGTKTNDEVGSRTVVALPVNGHYVVPVPAWDDPGTDLINPSDDIANVGAVRWCNGTTGCTGELTTSNSLHGTTTADAVGTSVTALSNGNFVVESQQWDIGSSDTTRFNVGAVTWCNGSTGCDGPVSTGNSLVGDFQSDQIGRGGVINLTGSNNYVISSPLWGHGANADVGAVTYCNSATGCTGTVSAARTLTGSTVNDQVGAQSIALSTGDYVVRSPMWDDPGTDGTITSDDVANVGAVTRCSGQTGCSGTVTKTNSLYGTTAQDQVGGDAANSVVALTNGNYVVRSSLWNNAGLDDVGAVTWCSGAPGCTGPVATTNSIYGTSRLDYIGGTNSASLITPLSDGDFVVRSPVWDSLTPVRSNVGAVTWCSGVIGCSGPVSATNSLVGFTANDQVGSNGVYALTGNGNYVVSSPFWDDPGTDDSVTTDDRTNVGAVTWCDGVSGCQGRATTTNSAHGSTASDQVGNGGVTPLPDGNFVIASSEWDSGSKTGGVTWGDGSTGGTRLVGALTASNTVAGISTAHRVGNGLPRFDSTRNKLLIPSVSPCGSCDRILVITVVATSSTSIAQSTVPPSQSTATTTPATVITSSTSTVGEVSHSSIPPQSTSTSAAGLFSSQEEIATRTSPSAKELPATGDSGMSSLIAATLLLTLGVALIATRRRLAT